MIRVKNERGVTFGAVVELVIERCPECWISWGIPKAMRDRLIGPDVGKPFYCPRGHVLHFDRSARPRPQESGDDATRSQARKR